MSKDKVTREYLIGVMHRLPGTLSDISKDIRAGVRIVQEESEKAHAQVAKVQARLDELLGIVYELVNAVQQALGVKVIWKVTQDEITDECPDALKEKLADLCHEQWSGWWRYAFRFGKRNADGTFTINADKVERWERQMNTLYAHLSEKEKDSDRKEAQRFLDLICT